MIVSQNRDGILNVRGLRKAYGETVALAGVDLDVARGEIVGLLGPNGAGKTTLVSIVAGLRRADAGEVRVMGVDALADPHRARAHLGFAPQETGVYPGLSCRDNLRFFAELTGLRRRALTDAIDAVAEALQLTDLLERPAVQLSGGERRRLHTAIALVHRPPLVMLDEPTTGADVTTRTQLLDLVTELAAAGSAVVYSTHYLPEVEQLDASVVVIERGRAIARGSVSELIGAHAVSIVELTFDGPSPVIALDLPGDRIERADAVLRVHTHAPDRATTAVIEELGDAVRRLRGLDVVRPNLETAFLALTGRRPEPSEVTADVA